MGLFDGPVVKFAKTFCEYLDKRVEERYAESKAAKEAGDNWRAMVCAIVGEALSEVSTALKTIAEL